MRAHRVVIFGKSNNRAYWTNVKKSCQTLTSPTTTKFFETDFPDRIFITYAPYTVIQNENFSALTLLDDIMLRNTFAAYSWTS